MDTLPEISSQRQSLTGKQQAIRSVVSIGCFEDSSLQPDQRESLASASRHSTGGSIRPISPGGAHSPIPPNTLRPSIVSPRAVQNKMRKSVESIRLSRSEWSHKEQLMSNLRSDNLQLQQKVRDLEHSKKTATLLQSMCSKLAQHLNCSIEGVASESISDILTAKISTLTQENRMVTQQIETCRGELERARGDLAATNVRCTNLQSQLSQSKSEVDRREVEIVQLKSEMENLQQTCARTTATVQSLRQQVTEAEGNKTSQSLGHQLTQLQIEVGRLRNEISAKNDTIEGQQLQLCTKQSELEEIQERASAAESEYADLYAQLCVALQLESDDSFDSDHLISQVSGLVGECSELKLRMETVTSTMKTVELDSKANRETILRLVSEAKKHEDQAEVIAELKKSSQELRAALVTAGKDKEGLEERLLVAKQTLLAQEKEMKAKEAKTDSLCQQILGLQRNSSSERSLADSSEQKYQNLCESLRDTLGVQTKDSSLLLSAVQQLIKESSSCDNELLQRSSELAQLQELVDRLQTELAQCKDFLKTEREKIKQLEESKISEDILSEGLTKELEKHKDFTRRLSRAINLDNSTAEILSGDFAHDAILTKAEQLANNETQTLTEKQTAIYTLQRRLKSCRQSLDSKELHLGLVQKKITILEEQLLNYAQKEKEWTASIDKSRKMEKQMERLHGRAIQQKQTILQLKEEIAEVQPLKTQNVKLEEQVTQLLASLEEVSQARVHQAQQLAEARQRQASSKTQAIVANSQDKAEIERLQGELENVRQQLKESKQREREMSSFKAAVKGLLRDKTNQDEENPSDDYSLVAKLEQVLAFQQRSRETTKCLEASLRQLESGFKSSYNDALTLLAADHESIQ